MGKEEEEWAEKVGEKIVGGSASPEAEEMAANAAIPKLIAPK